MNNYEIVEAYRITSSDDDATYFKLFDMRHGVESSNGNWLYSIYFYPAYVEDGVVMAIYAEMT